MNASKLLHLIYLVIVLVSVFFISTAVCYSNDTDRPELTTGRENVEYQNGRNEPIDLSAWHPQYRERCYFIDRKNLINSNTQTINDLLILLNKEPRIANYLLSTAHHLKTAFCIDERDDGTRGYYDYKFNIIGLKENLGLLEKLIIFVHELRHIVQFSRGFYNSLEYDIEEMIRMNFAIEADVQAIVILYAWRMKEMDIKEVWDALSGFPNYIDIAEEFDAEIQRSGDELKAANAAFVQWYKSFWRVDNYYKSSYSWYVDMLDKTKRIQTYKKLPENYFTKLCMLPCELNFGCHLTDEIKRRPIDIITTFREHSLLSENMGK